MKIVLGYWEDVNEEKLEMPTSILVVDDEPMTRDLLRLMLTPFGFTVHEAVDGVDALEKMETARPDLVVLDLMMPRMDGMTLHRRLREDASTADIPIIILTARSRLETYQTEMAGEPTRILTKPASRSDLLHQIREVLSTSASVSV